MKPIIVNAAETKAALMSAIETLEPVTRRRDENVVNIAYQRLVRNELALVPVHSPLPSDPNWVRARLSEGREVYRIVCPPYFYRREVCLAWVHLRKLMRALQGELDDIVDGHGDVARMKKLMRSLKRVRRMSVEDFDRVCARWRRRGSQSMPPCKPPVPPEDKDAGDDLPREVVQFGPFRMLRCTSLDQIATLGASLRNCLSTVGSVASDTERYELGYAVVWEVQKDGVLVGAAAVSCLGDLQEAAGPRNAPLPEDAAIAVQRLADILRERGCEIRRCDRDVGTGMSTDEPNFLPGHRQVGAR